MYINFFHCSLLIVIILNNSLSKWADFLPLHCRSLYFSLFPPYRSLSPQCATNGHLGYIVLAYFLYVPCHCSLHNKNAMTTDATEFLDNCITYYFPHFVLCLQQCPFENVFDFLSNNNNNNYYYYIFNCFVILFKQLTGLSFMIFSLKEIFLSLYIFKSEV